MKAWIVVVAAFGCRATVPDPTPRAVDPSVGYNGEDTVVTVVGEAFYPQVEIDASGRGTPDVDAGFTARLVRGEDPVAELSAVGLVDYEHLQAVVPAGIEPGTYGLVVVGPAGTTGRLDGAFTVTDTRADRLDVVTDALTYEVFDVAVVDLALVDPTGAAVLDDLDVELVVTGDDGPVDVTFEDFDLLDGELLSGVDGVAGRLGTDGRARVSIRVGTPGLVTVTAGPRDETSAVADGQSRVLFEPGSERNVRIDLPEAGFEAVAGEPFVATLTLVDQFGNEVEGEEETVVLQNRCGTWVDVVDVLGPTDVEVTLVRATGAASCPEDGLATLVGPSGASDTIEVRAGPAARFDVVVSPAEVVAGSGGLNVFVTPVDAWGNFAVGSGAPLTLVESSGEELVTSCFGVTPVFCTAAPVRAGDALTVAVSDATGVEGTSNAHRVLPSTPVRLVVEAPASVEAGQPFDVRLVAEDVFGNPWVPDASAAIDADLEVPDCVATDPGWWSCALTVATPSAQLGASWRALDALDRPVEVINGPLVAVEVGVADATVTAGGHLDVSLAGRDAWGNAYEVGADVLVEVALASGGASTEVALDAGGGATVALPVTRAGADVVIASDGVDELGRSEPITVSAAAASALVVAPGEPWVFVGDAVDVRILAVDAFGNGAPFDGAVLVGSGTSAFAPVAAALDDGVADVTLSWSASASGESVVATSEALGAASAPISVAERCGDGPTAHLGLPTADEASFCLDGGVAEVAMSVAGSVGPIVGAVFSAGDARIEASATAVASVVGAGAHEIRALVVDARGCGDEAVAIAWAGPNDGSATGPLAVSATGSPLAIGASGLVVSVDGALDCAGEAAAGSVSIRGSRGVWIGPEPTGSGLALSLDAFGDGAAVLDAVDVETGGVTDVFVRSASGSAAGSVAVVLQGDVRRPRVVDATPSGRVTGVVTSATFRFDEALLPGSVVPEQFRVDGPAAVTVTSATLDPTGRAVTLSFDAPVDASAGAWSLVAARELRDLSGNKLDGARTGESLDAVVPFGAVPTGPIAAPTCAADRAAFRPDGDPGDGIEADAVDVVLSASAVPAWWVVRVTPALSGDPAREVWVAAVGALDTWRWDGRGDDGAIVADGDYLIRVASRDEHGNRSPWCTASVAVDNRRTR